MTQNDLLDRLSDYLWDSAEWDTDLEDDGCRD